MTCASNPIPAMTRNGVPASSGSTRRVPVSMSAEVPVSAVRSAHSGRSRTMSRLRASRLPVPIGRMPSSTSVPMRASATARTVPSPPPAMTTSTPASTASRAGPRPGSSTVVSRMSGSCQPHSRLTSARRRRAWSAPVFVGLRTSAARLRRSGPSASPLSAASSASDAVAAAGSSSEVLARSWWRTVIRPMTRPRRHSTTASAMSSATWISSVMAVRYMRLVRMSCRLGWEA